MKRAAIERPMMERRAAQRRRVMRGWCDHEIRAGMFRKRRPTGCAKPKCIMCHGDKVFGLPTRHEILSKIKLMEDL